jgi:hypothetical protein
MCSYVAQKHNEVIITILIIFFLHGLGRLTCSGIDALPSRLIRRYPRLRIFAYEYFMFYLGGLPARPQNPRSWRTSWSFLFVCMFVCLFNGRPRHATDVLHPAGLLYRPLWTFQLWPPDAPAPTDVFRTLAAEVGTYGRGKQDR